MISNSNKEYFIKIGILSNLTKKQKDNKSEINEIGFLNKSYIMGVTL